MDINKIRFTPKANAFSDVYSKATGVPFIGEMMAAAAGNGDTELKIKSLTINYEYVEANDEDGWVATIVTNKAFKSEELSYVALQATDSNINGFGGNALISCEGNTVKVLCNIMGQGVTFGEEVCNPESSFNYWWVSFQIVNQEDNIVVTDFCYTANAPTVWYVAYGDKDGTVETSRGTGELTGVTEKIDEYSKLQEGILLTNNNYPKLVGQHIWFDSEAAVNDGNVYQIYVKEGKEFVPFGVYGSFFSEEPETPTQDVR